MASTTPDTAIGAATTWASTNDSSRESGAGGMVAASAGVKSCPKLLSFLLILSAVTLLGGHPVPAEFHPGSAAAPTPTEYIREPLFLGGFCGMAIVGQAIQERPYELRTDLRDDGVAEPPNTSHSLG